MRYAYLVIICSIASLVVWEMDWKSQVVVLLASVFLSLATYWDIKSWRIPNRLNLAFGLAMLGATYTLGNQNFARALTAGLLVFLAFLILHIAYPAGLGLGDVKLVFGLGMFLGWFSMGAVMLGLMLAIVLNALSSLILVFLSKNKFSKKQALPFAPALSSGSLLGVLFM